MIGILVAIISILVAMICVLAYKIQRFHVAYMAANKPSTLTEHNRCVHTVTRAVGRKHEADSLRRAAAAYDSASGHHRLQVVLSRPAKVGVSVPAAWMLDRADQIDPPAESEKTVYDVYDD